MKVFLLVCLAAAVYAEPEAEADPLMVLGNGLVHQPLMYNTHVASPLLKAVVNKPVVYKTAPVVQYAAPQMVQYAAPQMVQYAAPQMVQYAAPLAQRATVHQTPKLVGPGGEVDAKTAVAGDLTAYTVYHKEVQKREAESDPAVLLPSAYSGVYGALPSVYNTGLLQHSLYNTGYQYTTPYTYGHGLRLVKREAEAESEADPALLYRSAYAAGVPLVNSALYRPAVYSSVARPVVSSPYYNTLGYRYNGWY